MRKALLELEKLKGSGKNKHIKRTKREIEEYIRKEF